MTYGHFGMVRFDPGAGNVLVGGLGSVPDDTGIEVSRQQFAPHGVPLPHGSIAMSCVAQ